MPSLVLAPALSRWLEPAGGSAPERRFEFSAGDVRGLLDALYALHPLLRSYVEDEHGRLRHHLTLFVDGAPLRDKRALATPVSRELYLMQALSGG